MAEQKQPPVPSGLQDMRDAKIRAEEEKRGGAPTPERPVNTPKKYAKGGSVRGHGCETKGKTKGKFV
jgi:hypothetical protein